MPKEVEYEIALDATEATLKIIEEQLESDSVLWQAEGASKVNGAEMQRPHFRVLNLAP